MAEKTEVAYGSAGVEQLSHLWDKGNRLFQERLADGDTTITTSIDTSVSVSSVMSDLKKAQETASASYGPKLSRIMKRMELFIQIGEMALKNTSKEAEMVWGCFGFIFQMGLDDNEACELLTDGVDEATDAIFVSEIYGKRHYQERMAADEVQTKKLNDNVLDKIPHIYAAVLEFAYNARKFMKHGKAGRILRFYKMRLKTFQGNVDEIKSKKNDLTLVAGIGFEEAARDGLKHIQNGLKKLDELEKISDQLKELRAERARDRQAKDEARALQEYNDQVQWFRTTADPVKRHQKNLGRKQAGTCRWLFQEPDYKRWSETSEVPLLWLSATQGFGKSVLVSSIIEELETEISNNKFTTEPGTAQTLELIYFFIQTGSDNTQTAGKILQHVFFQLFFKAGAGNKKLRDRCTEIVKTAKGKIRGSSSQEMVSSCNMSVQELRPLFESVIQAFEKQIVLIIDGLDECRDLEKENFLGILKGLSKAGLPIKLLVASRPEHFIETSFTDITRIDVTKGKTQKDIQLYLIEEVREIQHIPKDKKKQAAKIIHKKADGMFRYANLAIDFLRHPFRGTFQQKLDRFPDAMEDFYKQNLEKMDEKMRELLLIALRWRIYGQGAGVDYTAVQVAEEFEHKYEDETSTNSDGETRAIAPGHGDEGEEDDWWSDGEDESKEEARKTEETTEGSKESEFQLTLELLRRAGGEFLAIGQNNILELRHKSVQDFIIDYAEKVTKKLVHRRTFCSSCLEREQTSFIYQLGPRQAHLHMALICLKHLNNKQFQQEHLLEKPTELVTQENPEETPKELEAEGVAKETAEEEAEGGAKRQTDGGTGEEAKGETQATNVGGQTKGIDGSGHGGADGEGGEANGEANPRVVQAGEGAEPDLSKGAGEDGREDTPSEIEGSAESASDEEGEGETEPDEFEASDRDPLATGDDDDIDAQSDNGYDLADYRLGSAYENQVDYNGFGRERYEFRNWDKHIKEAWQLSYGDGLPELEQSELSLWGEIWDEVEKFLVEDSPAFLAWQKKKYPWRDFFEKPIHIASRCALIEMLERYVKNGVDINTPGQTGHTPVHNCNNLGATQILVEHGANINAQDIWEQTPLLCGIAYSLYNTPIIKYVLEHGADPCLPDESGTTCAHWGAHYGDVEVFKLLLEHKADVNVKDVEGETPLHWLLKSTTASTPVLELLLENGADINAKDNSEQGPLYEAVKAGNLAAVRILLKRGASVNGKENVFGRTALHVAVDAGNVEMTKALIETKAVLDIRDQNGLTPLAVAAYKGLADLVKLLLETEKGSDVEYRGSADKRSRTGLHYSASKGHMEVVKLLLDTPDAAVLCNKPNEHGATPLHAATRRENRHEIVKVLLDKGGDINIANRFGKTPFDLALHGYAQHYEPFRATVKLLVQTDPKLQDLRLLHTAVSKGDEDFCRMLFKAGLDPTVKDSHGWDAVAIAEQYDHESTITPVILAECSGAPFLFNSIGVVNDADGSPYKPPTAWSMTDKSTYISVSDGLTVFESSAAKLGDVGSVRANHPIPADVNIFYYEITVLNSKEEAPVIGLGFCDEWALIQYALPGWVTTRALTWGWHADDANLYSPDHEREYDQGRSYGRNWGTGDTVGCGVDFGKGNIFYTMNGDYFGPAFTEPGPRGRLFPMCGMRVGGHKAKWRTNFGGEKFVFDIEKYKRGEKIDVVVPPPREKSLDEDGDKEELGDDGEDEHDDESEG